jgi:phosphatidylserine decarboxylase
MNVLALDSSGLPRAWVNFEDAICYYAKEGQNAVTGGEFGFIKFGSRVDIFLPLGTQIDVKIGQKVQAKLTKLGQLSEK